jgi:hypothetical protein
LAKWGQPRFFVSRLAKSLFGRKQADFQTSEKYLYGLLVLGQGIKRHGVEIFVLKTYKNGHF